MAGTGAAKQAIGKRRSIALADIATSTMAALVCGCFAFFGASVGRAETAAVAEIGLSAEEAAFLAEHKVLRLGVSPDYPPFDFVDEAGVHQGIAADLLTEAARRMGVKFELVHTSSWAQTLEFARTGRIDVISALALTEDRLRFLNFTGSYLNYPIVVVTQQSAPFMEGMEELRYRTVALPAGYFGIEYLRANYPDVTITPTTSLDEALRLVAIGKAYATIDNLAVLSYRIRSLGLLNLKVAARAWKDGGMAAGVRKDWPLLASALNKALNSISTAERQRAYNRWAAVTDERELNPTQALIWVTPPLVALLAIIAVMVIGNRKLARAVAQRGAAEMEARAQAERAEAALRDLRFARDQVVQAEKLASMGRMVVGLAHEINTPLGILIATASTIEDDTRHLRMELADERLDRDTLDDYLQRVDRASLMQERTLKRMETLVERFKRLAEEPPPLDAEPVPLLPLCRDVARNLEGEAIALGHFIFVDGDAKVTVETHRHVLADIIASLIDNALKHAYKPGCGGEVRVRVDPSTDAGATIMISDAGRGVPADRQSVMFDPFYTTERGAGHLGLGLTIAQHQATAQLRGRIDMISAPGVGTSFIIHLPHVIADPVPGTSTTTPGTTTASADPQIAA